MYKLTNLNYINKVCSSCKYMRWKSFTNLNKQNKKLIHLSNSNSFFHEPDPEYKDNLSALQHFRDGLQILKKEVKTWKNEVIETIEMDDTLIVPGAIDKVFTFENIEKLDQWVTTADSDNNSGYSSCELTVNEYGIGIFQGVLNTEIPADGKLSITGYCNMRSKRVMKSFLRDSYYEWGCYTHLVFRVRGDGRPYMINLATPGYYDVVWNDMYQYVLHTRGGPYWQTTKIPFSKFILASKGKIQDTQCSVSLDNISNLGLTIVDRVDGPFKLEIDYIGLEYDPDFKEEFAYEMYKLPKNLANS